MTAQPSPEQRDILQACSAGHCDTIELDDHGGLIVALVQNDLDVPRPVRHAS